MATARILAQGQVTLPSEIRHAAGFKPGDVLEIEVLGPGQIRVTRLPNHGPRELRDRFPIEGPIEETADREAWPETAARETFGSRDG